MLVHHLLAPHRMLFLQYILDMVYINSLEDCPFFVGDNFLFYVDCVLLITCCSSFLKGKEAKWTGVTHPHRFSLRTTQSCLQPQQGSHSASRDDFISVARTNAHCLMLFFSKYGMVCLFFSHWHLFKRQISIVLLRHHCSIRPRVLLGHQAGSVAPGLHFTKGVPGSSLNQVEPDCTDRSNSSSC